MATRAPEPPTAADVPGPEPIVVRPMTEGDLGAVLEIERAAFTVPWTPATFRGLLRRADSHLRVAEAGGRIVGYAAVWIVADQAELGDIAVSAEWRRRGVGRLLLASVFELVRERGVRELYLEVRVSNADARRLYERHGFHEVGLRRNYYDRPREDALVLRRTMEPAPTDDPDDGAHVCIP